jgi:hypothetical protein
MSRIWMDFKAILDPLHPLPGLTTCLQDRLRDQIPYHNATIADFATCLREMGMKLCLLGYNGMELLVEGWHNIAGC